MHYNYMIGKNPFELGKNLEFDIGNGALFRPHESPRKMPDCLMESFHSSSVKMFYKNIVV